MSDRPLHNMAADVGEDAPLLSGKVLSSAASFALFGLLGLVLSLTVFPLLYLLPIGSQIRKQYARKILAIVFPLFERFMTWCGLVRLNRQGCDTLRKGGQLIIANHPSLLDVVYMLATVGNANCLVKRSLFFNPCTAFAVRTAGYIRNDSDTLLEDCAASLGAGDSLIIFPEGTRTDPRKPFRFLRGPANIALAAECDIRPVVIRVRPGRLMKHQAWYEMSTETMKVDIEACPSIAITPYLEEYAHRSKAARRLTADLENFYLCR